MGKLIDRKYKPKKSDGVISGSKKTTRIALMVSDIVDDSVEDFLELLQVSISKRHWIKMVEHDRADLMKELDFHRSGNVDVNTAKSVGKMAGADGMLRVKISKIESDFFSVIAKLINTETGEVLSSAKSTFKQLLNCCCKKTNLINKLYARRKESWVVTDTKYKWIESRRCNFNKQDGAEKVIYACAGDNFCGK